MKIGIFTDSYRPYTSGVVRSIETFTGEFLKWGHQVYIFGPDSPLIPPRHQSRYQSEKGVYRFFSIPAPTFSDYAIPVPVSLQLRSTVKKLGLDIIHVHSPFLLGRLGARMAKKLNIPLVFTFHTLYEQYVHYVPFAKNVSRKMVRRISRDFCNRCDLVITPSSPVMNHLKRMGVTTPVNVIPTGLDLEEFKDLNPHWLQENFPIEKEDRVLLFVGRLGKEKNLFFLMKCFKEVLTKHSHLKLVLIGSGPLENSLRNLARDLGIKDQVIFTGLLSREQIVHAYASADIFTFPSVTETQGLVIGEAKAAGLPVVAINAFGTSDMIKHGEDGFLCKPSREDFTNRIIALLDEVELYQTMQNKALENSVYLSSSYCAERMLQKYQIMVNASNYDSA